MEKIKKSTNDLMKLGIGGMAGLGAMGAISNIPGMPAEAKGLMPIAGAGVQIGMIGGMMNVATSILPEDKSKKTKSSGKGKDDIVSKILG